MAREPLLSYNIPFWSLDVRGLVTAPKRISKGYTMDADHAHPHYEMVFNFSPIPVRHSVHGEYHETNGRYILWRAPYVLHSMRTLSDADYIRSQICFPPFVMKECTGVGDIGRLRHIRACTIPVTEAQLNFFDSMIQHMRYLWENGVPEKIRYGVLAALLYEIGQLVPQDIPAAPDVEEYIQEVMYYIAEHLEEDLTMDTLSRKFFVGKTKLAQDFQAVTSQSVHEYVTLIRLYYARSLLEEEDTPLSVIAFRCGFSGAAAFIRIFRSKTGMTPGEWRRRREKSESPDLPT